MKSVPLVTRIPRVPKTSPNLLWIYFLVDFGGPWLTQNHSHYLDYLDLRSDGRVVLYKRADHQNPKWSVSLRVPGAKGFRSQGPANFDPPDIGWGESRSAALSCRIAVCYPCGTRARTGGIGGEPAQVHHAGRRRGGDMAVLRFAGSRLRLLLASSEIGSSSEANHLLIAFRKGLSATGYGEGRNVLIEYPWTDGQTDRFKSDFQ